MKLEKKYFNHADGSKGIHCYRLTISKKKVEEAGIDPDEPIQVVVLGNSVSIKNVG